MRCRPEPSAPGPFNARDLALDLRHAPRCRTVDGQADSVDQVGEVAQRRSRSAARTWGAPEWTLDSHRASSQEPISSIPSPSADSSKDRGLNLDESASSGGTDRLTVGLAHVLLMWSVFEHRPNAAQPEPIVVAGRPSGPGSRLSHAAAADGHAMPTRPDSAARRASSRTGLCERWVPGPTSEAVERSQQGRERSGTAPGTRLPRRRRWERRARTALGKGLPSPLEVPPARRSSR